jgi:uncharacterized protein involved in exopolysaccharide biosynthesis
METREAVRPEDDDVSLLALGAAVLRRRRTIVALAVAGGVIGLATGLLSTRVYVSSATFIPTDSEGGASGLALAASQFGIKLPTGGAAWRAPVYVELIRSRALLEPIAQGTVTVVEDGSRTVPLADLLKVKTRDSAQRVANTVIALRKIVSAGEMKTLGAVRYAVRTPWPSVSHSIANQLLAGLTRFNLETRKSQASAERVFVEKQATEAGEALRAAEDRLQSFNQQNRAMSSSSEPQLTRDRLDREVQLRLQVYMTLLQSRDEARIREARDTPVITLLEEPRLPLTGEARRSILKAVIGGTVGGVIGVLLAILGAAVGRARQTRSEDARDFFTLIDELTPRFLRRAAQ